MAPYSTGNDRLECDGKRETGSEKAYRPPTVDVTWRRVKFSHNQGLLRRSPNSGSQVNEKVNSDRGRFESSSLHQGESSSTSELGESTSLVQGELEISCPW